MGVMYLYLFIFGLFLGSFYNVVATRMPNNESIIYPGSHCVNCRHRLAWYELIPVFSYLFLRGKCKVCKKKISIEYPLIEILTGILFALSYKIFGFTYETMFSIILVSIIIITLVSDCKYMVILDEVLIVGVILLLITLFLMGGFKLVFHQILSGLIIFALMLSVKLIGDRAFKQESLGWGDIKLSFIAGLTLGIKLGIVHIFIGAILALPYAIFVTVKKKNNMIPFGPFLVTSILLLYWNSEYAIHLLTMLIGGK